MASNSASRVFSGAQIAWYPEARVSQPMIDTPPNVANGWIMRSGLGSMPEVLPK